MKMKNKKEEKHQEIRCPDYPDECGFESHPPYSAFCPITGKALPLKIPKIGRNGIIISFSIIVLIVLTVFLAERFGLITIRMGKISNPEPPELPQEILQNGGKILLELQNNTNGFELMSGIVEAYLEKHGVLNIEKVQNGENELIVKGVLPGRNEPIIAEIHPTPPSNDQKRIDNLERSLIQERENRKTKVEECYNTYLNLSKKYYNEGNWDNALENVNNAIKLKSRKEADNLKNKILIGKGGKGKVVSLLRLPDNIREDYYNKMEIISIGSTFKEPTGAKQIALSLLINEKGNIKMEGSINSRMEKEIKRQIGRISLSPPRDKSGNPVKVRWRPSFNLEVIEGKLILLRRN
jgi:hypothetical protein